MTDEGDRARRLVELPAQLALAAASLPQAASQMDWIRQWIETAMGAADPAAPGLGIELGATLESTGALVLEISGFLDRIVPVMGQFLLDCAIEEDAPERAELEQAVSTLGRDLDWLGYSTRVRGDAVSAGWFARTAEFGVAERLPVARALATVPRSPAAAALGRWAGQHGAGPCTRIGGEIGGGKPFAELVISLGDAPDRAFAAARELFDVLEVEPPPPAVLAGIEKRWGKREAPSLIVALTAAGASRLGILMLGADVDYVPVLPQLLDGTALDLETVARFEGLLGVEHARWLEVGRLGGAPHLGLRYRIE